MGKIKAHQDRPFRPPDPQSTEYREDVRLALIRTNERIDAMLRRTALIEQALEDNGISPLPPGPPSITLQPQNTSVTEGDTLALKVTASGTSPFTYQWQKE